MPKNTKSDLKSDLVESIQKHARELGRTPSRIEFCAKWNYTEHRITNHFDSWNEAVTAAGLEPNLSNVKVDDEALLSDWGAVVKQLRQIPTRLQYKRHGKFSVTTFVRFGPWATMPNVFRNFADGNPAWRDVLTLLPPVQIEELVVKIRRQESVRDVHNSRHNKIDGLPTFGDPIDFRGLRHEPVNEQGVVFLFGMVARELGYMVEAVQTGYPDCEAKRQIGPGKWQRVRVEFEFESRNFKTHAHATDGCDVIVCWRHNWNDCPANLEVLELKSVIKTLAASED